MMMMIMMMMIIIIIIIIVAVHTMKALRGLYRFISTYS